MEGAVSSASGHEGAPILGFNTPKSEEAQRVLVKTIEPLLKTPSKENQEQALQSVKDQIAKFDGFGLNELDKKVMGKIASNTRELKNTKNTTMESENAWLFQVRALIFDRANTIVQGAFDNPFPFREQDQAKFVQMIREGQMPLPQYIVDYYATLEAQGPVVNSELAKKLGVTEELIQITREKAKQQKPSSPATAEEKKISSPAEESGKKPYELAFPDWDKKFNEFFNDLTARWGLTAFFERDS